MKETFQMEFSSCQTIVIYFHELQSLQRHTLLKKHKSSTYYAPSCADESINVLIIIHGWSQNQYLSSRPLIFIHLNETFYQKGSGMLLKTPRGLLLSAFLTDNEHSEESEKHGPENTSSVLPCAHAGSQKFQAMTLNFSLFHYMHFPVFNAWISYKVSCILPRNSSLAQKT